MSNLTQQTVPEGYKLTEVGVIPEDWEIAQLDEFWSVTDCKHVTAKFVPNGFPLASIKEVQSRYVDLSNAKHTTHDFYKLLTDGKRKLVAGDLILSRNATVGEVAQVMSWHPIFAMGQDVCLLRKRTEGWSSGFLQELFAFESIKKQLDDCMVGTTFKRVNVRQVKELLVQMPQPEEQTAIANVLSDTDALITSLEKLIAKKRAIKTAAMQQLLAGKKRLPPFDKSHTGYKQTELGEIPEDWQVHQFGVCVKNFQLGGNYKNGDIDSGVPLVKMGNIARGYISLKKVEYVPKDQDVSEKDRCHYDDIYFNTRNTLDLVGKVSIWSDELPWAYFNSNLMRITFNNENVSSNRFMNYLMNSKYFIDALADIAIGTTSVAAIYTRDLVGLKIILPPCEEQKAIANVLLSMDHEIKRLEQQLHKTQQLKQGMMQELLTGKTRLIAGTA